MARVEGYLFKRGQMGNKRRYFVLDGSNLLYYGQKDEAAPRSQMVLGADSKIVELAGKKGECIEREEEQ